MRCAQVAAAQSLTVAARCVAADLRGPHALRVTFLMWANVGSDLTINACNWQLSGLIRSTGEMRACYMMPTDPGLLRASGLALQVHIRGGGEPHRHGVGAIVSW